jgi:hypothetical protein
MALDDHLQQIGPFQEDMPLVKKVAGQPSPRAVAAVAFLFLLFRLVEGERAAATIDSRGQVTAAGG